MPCHKCPNCNGCLKKKYRTGKNYHYCEFCGKYFEEKKKELKEVYLYNTRIGGIING